jgi:L-threonylcarbamoyladenylate synthase
MADPEQIAHAATIIQQGGVVAFPTETVYGLGANALNPAAIDKIYAIKQRPRTSPLIVHVASVNMAKSLVSHWPESAERLASRFWPGPLTLVLPKTAAIGEGLTAGLDTVGLRLPAHPVAQALIEAAGLPIAAPSANRFTQLSATTAEHVRQSLGPQVDYILDGGPTEVGIESTVVSLAGEHPVLLRPGMITQAEIESLIGPLQVVTASSGAHAAPGLHPKHYAPQTPLYLLHPGDPLPAPGSGLYLYWKQPRPDIASEAMPPEAAAYAAALYSRLHLIDQQGLPWVALEAPPADPAWAGVLDRLDRARRR